MLKDTIFQEKYDREKFSLFLKDFLINYKQEPEEIDLKEGFDKIKKLTFLGYDSRLDNLPVYEILHQSEKDPRVTLTRESFKVMRKLGRKNSLCIFLNKDSDNYRFSLIQIDFDINKGKIETLYSNPRRYSFYLGTNAKIHTPTTYLIKKGRVKDFKDLKERFSIEVVNKEFYNEISKLFTKLVGGKRIIGRKKIDEKGCLTLPEANNKLLRQEFGVRLIGRLIFCWFLVKKGIIDKDLFDVDIIGNKNYYHRVVEPLFFMVLNTKEDERKLKESFLNEKLVSLFEKIPFLNGGLFEPHKDDFYEQGFQSLSKYENSLKIENEWFKELFELFETYNFTVDENSSVDIELSIDPEMLGRIFENLLAEINPETSKPKRKSTGSYYTPRTIVDYMVDESLKFYLINETGIEEKKIEDLLKFENEEIVKDLNDDEKEKILDSLEKVKILDPACGSGAFPIGMLQKITLILQKIDPNSEKWLEKQLNQIKDTGIRTITKKFLIKQNPNYIHKKGILKNSIYGVDIQSIAVEISKLRCFLTLIVDQKFNEEENIEIEPLPNLEFKFVCANTLIGLTKVFDIQSHEIQNLIIELKEKVSTYFYSHSVEKEKTKKEIEEIQKELFETMLIWKETRSKEYTSQLHLSNWNPFSGETSDWFDPEWMLGVTDGFDIVIGNPPYVSTKGVNEKDKKILKEHYDFEDDLYNHFYFKGIDLLKDNGILAYISSKTFWTIQTKKNLRELLLKNKLLHLVDTANPFESAMVDTCITIVQKTNAENNTMLFIDAKKGLANKKVYEVSTEVFKNVVNNIFFVPNEFNLKVYEKLAKPVKALMDEWWNLISTSKNIEKNKHTLEQYRKSLKPGDITLLGLITEGGQGLATANNGKYVGVLDGTKFAEKILQERPKKLWAFIQNKSPKELSHLKNKNDVEKYLNNLSENEIRNLFDTLKEKYGRDIFGQGWLYRIVSKDEIADVEALTEDEKLNGIKGKKTFVPYDKGDKDGNRWWAPTPYYIDWSRENVKFLKDNSGKKGQGMPVVRNPQFYFREGFCWTDVSYDIRCRIKEKSVHDVLSMSLFSNMQQINNKYLICLLNSRFMSLYLNTFINTTVHFQINDARKLPIIIPTLTQLKEFEDIFNRAVSIQKQKFSKQISEQKAEERLDEIQKELDEKVLELYGLKEKQ
ncbi:MAG: hypothetical protein XD76_0533 [candidate division TA06 bacterium 32_111]|uniref:site-specific DNA-methyltransferase (adenine-specific) n=2 Tax=Bacteria candidate phyla TaxID=1783234 RepID=A0A101I2H8_UNCT6|nr:MAG: hypothetical protein XD76_0533 [candidate division TA06 bacterium 32_111]KUK87425.1 MAG: hypothetical protein XE03_0823 [candidate division TA06 bacterium 34_109]HAF07741.1 hypothetical protein [candidate division WOR-3 bacterium]HCP17259.1 hypothetical protein [candidate division WOR-3 bacterium]